MPGRTSLEDAINRVHAFFVTQAVGGTLTKWEVLSAAEDVAKGVYVIKCVEHGYMENDRTHEVWVSVSEGRIDMQRRTDTKH